MPDGQRHSVDIPLTKTLMTLKRVRSLRDPATVSMSKFLTSIDNMKWETNSCNDVLELKDSVNCNNQKNRFFCSDGGSEGNESDIEISDVGGAPDTKYNPINKSSRLLIAGFQHKHCDSTWVPNFTKFFEEEMNSCSGPNLDKAKKVGTRVRMKKGGRTSARNLSAAVEGNATGHIASPCLPLSEARSNRSSHSLLSFPNEEINAGDSVYSGCGLSSCWSRTPKFKDLSNYSDAEDQDHPLLSAPRREAIYREPTMCLSSPRSLSQKYRPKTFNQIVGLRIAGQSLMNAISRGKVSPIYLFHGPRGTGKTSMARIFAAALNCLSLEANRPCGFCRECTFLFSGRSRDVKEVDGSKINRKDRIKSLLKSVALAPYSSSFKVFIIDECQFLQEEAWPAILNCLEEISRRAVFIMITSELDKLPCSYISRCQRYHFPKIKDAEIVCRLQKICVDEVLDFDKEALDFIAGKSNGSLRDAETMLDQLSLLGKKITLPLAYELVGVISDDELLDLLDLALSSDTSNTVRRARELMSSKVDPMQLISQLANIIMDILAGRCQSGRSEAERTFFGRHTVAEVGLQKLRRALKILSETEKQLRTSKNQATWLTVALLQFSSEESSLTDVDDSKLFLKSMCLRDDGLCCMNSPRESQKGSSDHKYSKSSEQQEDSSRKLEAIWRGTVEKCQTDSFRRFLLKEGTLSSIHVSKGLAIAELQFSNAAHISRAEKSWKQIATSLQLVMGTNVEIRISLSPCITKKNFGVKKMSFDFLSCAGRKHVKSDSSVTEEHCVDTSTSREKFLQVYTDDYGQNISPVMQLSSANTDRSAMSHHERDVCIRDVEGNSLSAGVHTPNAVMHPLMATGCNLGVSDALKADSEDCQYSWIQEPENQPCCFPKRLKLPRKFLMYDGVLTSCSRMRQHDNLELSSSKNASSGPRTCLCSNNSYVFCSASGAQIAYTSGNEELSKEDEG